MWPRVFYVALAHIGEEHKGETGLGLGTERERLTTPGEAWMPGRKEGTLDVGWLLGLSLPLPPSSHKSRLTQQQRPMRISDHHVPMCGFCLVPRLF